MKILIDLPDHDGNALDVIWEQGAKCSLEVYGNNIVIKADPKALISLAKQMLYMAYNELPAGSHVHYDDFFIDCAQYELTLEKQET